VRKWQAGRDGRYDLDGLIAALDGVLCAVEPALVQ
jgi:hypothetical protein